MLNSCFQVDVWNIPQVIKVQNKRKQTAAMRDKHPALKIGQNVLLMYPFSSFGGARWNTEEVFKIIKVDSTTRPLLYNVADSMGNAVSGRCHFHLLVSSFYFLNKF